MNLDELRKNIDAIDSELRTLFSERMKVCDDIAELKSKTNDTIYKPEREREVISLNSAKVAPEIRQEYSVMISHIMELSRKHQYMKNHIEDARNEITVDNESYKIKFCCLKESKTVIHIASIINDYGYDIEDVYVDKEDGTDMVYVSIRTEECDDNLRLLIYHIMMETRGFKLI